MRYLVLLILGGCGSLQTTDEMGDELLYCKVDCEELQERYNRRLAHIERRREMTCPVGWILWVDKWGQSCVSRGDAERALQGLNGRSL